MRLKPSAKQMLAAGKNEPGLAKRAGMFVSGLLAGTVLGLSLSQVFGTVSVPGTGSESLGGAMTGLLGTRSDQAEVMLNSVVEAEKSKGRAAVLVEVPTGMTRIVVPEIATGRAAELPDISGLPAAEVFRRCAPDVHPKTMSVLAREMSGGNVWSAGRVGGRIYASSTYEGAVRLISRWRSEGVNFNVGLMQINPSVLARYGLSAEEALEPCTNIHAAAAVLADAWESEVKRTPASPQLALANALEAYRRLNYRALPEAEEMPAEARPETQGLKTEAQAEVQAGVRDAPMPGLIF